MTHVFNPNKWANVTYPVTRPASKGAIDYILYSGLKLVSAEVLDHDAAYYLSDHLAVTARFELL
jgi:endonuclease/exonuclease/phosphatase family metal-dependent hydrolase